MKLIKNTFRNLFIPQPDLSNSNLDRSLINRFNELRASKNIKQFCWAPSTNMLFNQDGKIYSCCHNKTDFLGQYPAQNLNEIWNSPKAIEFRKNMTEYNISDACKVCLDDFNRGAFNEMRSKHFDSLPKHPDYPVMMEFLLSNQCNLECVMCSGEYSSLIRKNREGLEPLKFPYDDKFIDQLDEFIPHLKEVRFSGSGEAFSIDINYTIWERIVQINPKCLIVIQTNGTILTERVKRILEKGNFQIGISIDSLKKEVFESIRINANYDKIMRNLEYFRDYTLKKNNLFKLSFCVMRNNWNETPDFIRFCNKNQAFANFHKVWEPSYLSIYNLDKTQLSAIHDTLSKENFTTNSKIEKQNSEHYKYYINAIREWRDQAPDQQEVILKNNGKYNRNEAYVIIVNKLKKHIDIKANNETLFEEELSYCSNKLFTVLENIPDNFQKDSALKAAQQIPAEQLYNHLKNNHLSFLLDSFNKMYKSQS